MITELDLKELEEELEEEHDAAFITGVTIHDFQRLFRLANSVQRLEEEVRDLRNENEVLKRTFGA